MADFKYLDSLLAKFVKEGPAGLGCIVAKDGETLYEGYHGLADIDSGRLMNESTVYRLFSMTKVIVCTAAMMLFERGKFLLNDPLYEYYPEWKDAAAIHTMPDGSQRVEKLKNPILVKHAFSMGVGMPYAFGPSPTAKAMSEVKKSLTEKLGKFDLRTEIREMAKVPLASEPGEHFLYGYGHELVAGLVPLLTGKTLGEFLKEEIYEPCGMTDTAYRYFGNIRQRMATYYHRDDDGKLTPQTAMLDDFFEPDQIYEMGGAGLFSTVRDYSNFAQMLACGGIANGHQVIGRKTIDLMRRNQLTESALKDFGGAYLMGYGYGLGVRTLMDPAVGGANGTPGEFGWTGAAGTYVVIDPKEKFSITYMHQMAPNMEYYHHLRVRAAAYGALK